jgi:Fe-Mn family superoxide dismutase
MEPKSLNYKELPGLSQRQLSEHHDVLYAGYVKKVDEIRDKLSTVDSNNANATYNEYRELKMEEGFAWNAVKLHELYFENLGGEGQPKGEVLNFIEENYGSYDNWKKELFAAGMSARGWVVWALDEDDLPRFYICDAHNQGGIWNTAPLLVLDVYEHAYFIDYATDRKSYLNTFLNIIDWETVGNRL